MAVWNLKNWNIAILTWKLPLNVDLLLTFLRLHLHFNKSFRPFGVNISLAQFCTLEQSSKQIFELALELLKEFPQGKNVHPVYTRESFIKRPSHLLYLLYHVFLEWNSSNFAGNTKKIPLVSNESRFENTKKSIFILQHVQKNSNFDVTLRFKSVLKNPFDYNY